MNLSWNLRSRFIGRTAGVLVLGLVQLAVLQVADCSAGIGLAEWSIETPGKNRIAHSDQFPDQGVCLHQPAAADGVLDDRAVCVAHIEWWMYSGSYVVGKAKNGFFIFDERSKTVKYFDSQANLEAGMKQANIEKPLTTRFTPQDGWNIGVGLVMIDLYKQLMKDLDAGSGEAEKLSPAEREAQKQAIKPLLQSMQAQVAKTTDKLKAEKAEAENVEQAGDGAAER